MNGGSEKISGNDSFKKLELVAKHPIDAIRQFMGRGNTCTECIDELRRVRRELTDALSKMPGRGPRGVNDHFRMFYNYANNTIEHYVGLFSMLKEAGIQRVDIELALQDKLPLGKRSSDLQNHRVDTTNRSEAVRGHLSLSQSALDRVFPQ